MNYFFAALGAVFVFGVAAAGLAAYSQIRQARQARLNAKAENVKLTIIEGWDIADIGKYLEKQGILKAADFANAASSFSDRSSFPFLSALPASASLEGFLFPDTYLVPLKPTAEQIISKALENFGKRFQSLGTVADLQGKYPIPGFEALSLGGNIKGLSLYQVMTLASIVERETGRNAVTEGQKLALLAERKIVAGIFYNRLQAGWALESDATINYITGKSNPASLAADLKINSPYNTYIYPGLPPGPIGNPSLQSLAAVLHPTNTEYFYFLHKQPGGEVVYAKTFEDHVQNKFKYLK